MRRLYAPLDKAAYDYYHVDTTSLTDEQFKNGFCSIKESIDSSQQKTDASALAQAFFATFSQQKDEYHKMYSQFCQSTSYRFTSYQHGLILSRMVHDQSVRAWSSCVEKCIDAGGAGFQHRITNDDGTNFVYELRWRPTAGVDRAPITAFTVEGGSCTGTLKGKALGNDFIPVHCQRYSDAQGVGVVYITAEAKGRLGSHVGMILPLPPPAEIWVDDVVEKGPFECWGDRAGKDCVREGGNCIVTDPDRKIFVRIPCKAPGPILRIEFSDCPNNQGACGWMWRSPQYDVVDGDTVYVGWKTNSSDSSPVRTHVFYKETHRRCTNCSTPPPLRVIKGPRR